MCTTMRRLRRGTPTGRALVLRKRSITAAVKNLKNEMSRAALNSDISGFVDRIAILSRLRRAIK